jgi:8-oxo-dGTP pyrophosphatase MutT (NUDIX family)
MKKERREILRKLMHCRGMGFNELWGDEGKSNLFAYHLKVLVEDGLVGKSGDGYCLTHEGKKFSTYVEGTSGKRAKFPAVIVICVIYDEVEDRYVFMERTKEPFFGYWCWVGGKMGFDEFVYETAKKEIFEETGLTCDLEFKGILSAKTYSDGELSYNHQIFVVGGRNPVGELKTETREGRNFWLSEEEILEKKVIPSIVDVLEIAKGDGFRWVEMDRLQEGDEFVGKKVLRDERFAR